MNTSAEQVETNIVLRAAEQAYAALAAEQGISSDETVHRMRLCHRASTLLVDSLLEHSVAAERETRGGWSVLDHSYVVLADSGRIADPTWQQFLSPSQQSAELPRVLIGTRQSVVEQARGYGVTDPATLALWTERPAAQS